MARIVANLTAVVLLGALVFLASRDLLLGGLAIGISCFLVALVTLGGERMGFLLILLAMFTAPQNDVRPIATLDFLTFSDLFFAAGFALLLPSLTRRRMQVPITFLVGAMVIIYGVFIASLLSSEPLIGMFYGFRLVSAAVILPLAFLWWRPSLRSIDALAWGYVLGQCASTVYALFFGGFVGTRYVGLTTHPNFFGICGLMALGLLVHLWHRTPSKQRWLVLAAAGVSTYSVVLSGSRAALIVIVVLALLYPAIERSLASAYLLVAAALAAVIAGDWLVRSTGEHSALGRLTGGGTVSGSDIQRENALRLGLEKFFDNPIFGKGFSFDALDPHNIYLEVAVGIGIFGLVGFLAIGVACIAPIFAGGRLRHLGYATLAYAGVGMLTNSLWDRFVWAVLSLALLANLKYDDDSPEEAGEAFVEMEQVRTA